MTDNSKATPFEALQKVFHEPARLALVSELARAEEGLAFVTLRDRCGLTDGNLSRHLKTLDAAGVVSISKEFVGARPRTTVFLSPKGRRQFVAYLEALEQVLRHASGSLAGEADTGPGASAPAPA